MNLYKTKLQLLLSFGIVSQSVDGQSCILVCPVSVLVFCSVSLYCNCQYVEDVPKCSIIYGHLATYASSEDGTHLAAMSSIEFRALCLHTPK